MTFAVRQGYIVPPPHVVSANVVAWFFFWGAVRVDSGLPIQNQFEANNLIFKNDVN